MKIFSDNEDLKGSMEDFYNLLKSKMIGRVINGLIDGCILESELEEIYEQYCKSDQS
jgi:hypothetical protein